MGDLLLNWLNDEIQLSKRITNFQDDFHNGYLFGELLAKYSQQLNFHQFVDMDDKASRVKNYSLLIETFTALRVTYDSNIAMKIINKQLGVAKKLLYELKTALDKTNSNPYSKTNRMNKTLQPLKKLQISKQKYDHVNQEHFVKQLNQLHPAQKQIIQDRLLQKFGDFHTNSLMKTAHLQEKQRQGKLFLRKKFNEQQRENIKKSEEFRKQWEAEHLQKWAVNMTIRQTQVAKDQQFKSKIQMQKSHYQTMSEVNAMTSFNKDIDDFENKHLKKKQVDSDDEEPAPSAPEQIRDTSKINEKSQQSPPPQPRHRQEVREERRVSAAEAQRKRHQRQKRRRKMIVEQQKRYQMIEITRRQRIIISTIEQTSRQQKQIQYEIWRAWQNKQIITQNKNLHEDKIKQKNEVRDINAKFKKEELLKVKREEHRDEVKKALHANTLLERNNQVKNRKGGYAVCQNMVQELLDITEQMYISSQERNKGEINETQLEAALVKFVKGTKTPEEEACLRLKHYVDGSHEWAFPITRPEEEVPTDPKQQNALPNESVNNYYLGNVLHTIYEKLYQSNQSSQCKSSSQKLVISLVGLDYARKYFLAENIKQNNKFNVISVDKVIEEKVKDWQNLKQKGVQVSKQTEELVQACYCGKSIREDIIIQLIKDQIDKNPHSILVDYPNTYDQAIALCKAVGNVEPHDMLGTDKLAKKIKEYERLVKGTPSKIVERRVRQCGIDFVWWIDITAQNSFDRMLGRRWIGKDEVHINDNVQPEELRQGEKSSALVMNNHFKAKNKQKMKEWFELFGTQFGSENPVSAKCWEQIDGNCDKNALEWSIQAKVEQMLAIKVKQKQWNEQLEKQKKQKQQKEEEAKKQKEEIKAKCVRSSPEEIKGQLDSALAKVSLSQDFIEKTSQLWNKIQTSTISSLGRAFLSLEEQQQSQRKYIAQTKRNFISLLTRQDHKFHLIKDFQNNYNKFISQNEDMLVYDYTKEQLHQRVEDLQNDLLDVVQQKKEDAVTERNGVMGSGWLQAQFEIISQALFVLVQTQLNKFALSQKLITDFYGKKFMVNTKTFQPLSPELNLETVNALDIYKEGVAARLDKMISQAFRILNREEDVSDDKNKKGGKGAPPKKDDKKAAKKGGKDEVEQNKEPTPEQLELKKAINTQKAILRQRINRIKTLGLTKLNNTNECAQQLYTQLQDLFVYTQKVQKKAIFGLSKIFKKSIQSQQKIESEVQINHVEVTQTQKIRNFQKQKPVIQPARQTISSSHFTLSNIHEVMKLFREEAEGHKISTKKLIVLLKKLINHLQLRKLLPETWKSVKNEQIESFVKLLDHDNKAYVELFKILVFVVMSGFVLPNSDELEQYNLELTNYSSLKQTNLDDFMKVKAWFDQQPQQKQNIRPFTRNSHVKEMLFNIFKNPTAETIEIYSFVQAVALQEFFPFKQAQEGWTYFDMAFC